MGSQTGALRFCASQTVTLCSVMSQIVTPIYGVVLLHLKSPHHHRFSHCDVDVRQTVPIQCDTSYYAEVMF